MEQENVWAGSHCVYGVDSSFIFPISKGFSRAYFSGSVDCGVHTGFQMTISKRYIEYSITFNNYKIMNLKNIPWKKVGKACTEGGKILSSIIDIVSDFADDGKLNDSNKKDHKEGEKEDEQTQ